MTKGGGSIEYVWDGSERPFFVLICVSFVDYDWQVWWHIRLFFTRSSTNLPVKSNLKKKIGLAFSGVSIFNPICSLSEKSLIVGGSSFEISERGLSTSEPELGSFGELISSSDIIEASRLFGVRLCEALRVRVHLSLLLPPLVCTLELNPPLVRGLPLAGEVAGVSTTIVWPQQLLSGLESN